MNRDEDPQAWRRASEIHANAVDERTGRDPGGSSLATRLDRAESEIAKLRLKVARLKAEKKAALARRCRECGGETE